MVNDTPDFTVGYENIVGREFTQAMIEAVEKVSPSHLTEADYHLRGMLYAMQVKTDGSICLLYPSNGSTFTYEEKRAAVGGSIELVMFAPNCDIYVNDNGLPEKGIEGLPLNVKATALLWKCNPEYRKDKVGFHGNVLFIKR